MSNDGRSIGEHLREIEESVSRDSSATLQPERGRESGEGVTNRTESEDRENQRRVPPKQQRG